MDRTVRILIVGLLLSGLATASDQYASDYLKQLERQRTNAVAGSCRASLPNTSEKTYYSADGVLLEARDYCMFLAMQYVRQQLHAPAPAMATAEQTTSTSAK